MSKQMAWQFGEGRYHVLKFVYKIHKRIMLPFHSVGFYRAFDTSLGMFDVEQKHVFYIRRHISG